MTKSTKAAYQSADSLAQIRQAAEQGDVEAQVKLGAAYHNGEGVEQDFAEAVKWFRLAAAQGNAQAQNRRRTGRNRSSEMDQACRRTRICQSPG